MRSTVTIKTSLLGDKNICLFGFFRNGISRRSRVAKRKIDLCPCTFIRSLEDQGTKNVKEGFEEPPRAACEGGRERDRGGKGLRNPTGNRENTIGQAGQVQAL